MVRFNIHFFYLSKAYTQLEMLVKLEKIMKILISSNSVNDDKEPQVIKTQLKIYSNYYA
jgi:hypothetical protein